MVSFMISVAMVLFMSLIADILYAVVDPQFLFLKATNTMSQKYKLVNLGTQRIMEIQTENLRPRPAQRKKIVENETISPEKSSRL